MRDVDVRRARRRSLFARVRASIVAIVEESAYVRDFANSTQASFVENVQPPERLRVLATGIRLNARGLIVTAAKPILQMEERAKRNPDVHCDEFLHLNYLVARHTDPTGTGKSMRVDTFRGRVTGVIAIYDQAGVAILDGGGSDWLDRFSVRPLPRASSRCVEGDVVGVCGFETEVDLGLGFGGESLVPWFATGLVSSSTGVEDVGSGGFDQHFRLYGLLQRGYLGAPVFDVATGDWVGLITDEGNVDGSRHRPRGFVSCTDCNVLGKLEESYQTAERLAEGRPQTDAPLTWIPLP
jgi:hypothetical protein